MTWLPLDAVGTVPAHRADEEWVSPHHYRHGSPCQSCGQQWIAGQKGCNRGSSDWASGESVGWYRSRRWCRIGSMYLLFPPVYDVYQYELLNYVVFCKTTPWWPTPSCMELFLSRVGNWKGIQRYSDFLSLLEMSMLNTWSHFSKFLKTFKTFKIFHVFWAFKPCISLVQPVSAYLRSNPGVVAAAEPGAICFSAC